MSDTQNIPDIARLVKGITDSLRTFGTYDPFDKSYYDEFLNWSDWGIFNPEEASAFAGAIAEGLHEWLVRMEYGESEQRSIPRRYIESIAMNWDEAQYEAEGEFDEGLAMAMYETFCTHDPRVKQFAPNIEEGY